MMQTAGQVFGNGVDGLLFFMRRRLSSFHPISLPPSILGGVNKEGNLCGNWDGILYPSLSLLHHPF